MADDLSFKAVGRLLKQHEPKLFETFDTILGPAIVLSGLAGAALGFPEMIVVAGGLLGPKNALTGAGKTLLQRLTGKKYGGPLDRLQRMQIAYSLLPFSSFFDTIEEIFPAISKAFGLSSTEKLTLVKAGSLQTGAAVVGITPGAAASTTSIEAVSGILDQEIPLPHPAEGAEASESQPQRIHQELARGYHRFLQGLAEWEQADDKARKKIDEQVAKLPALALANYRAQYVDLARQFPEFFVWATLHEHEEHRAYLQKLSAYWERHVSLSQAAQEQVDLGFKSLGEAINALPSALAAHHPVTVINELLLRYADYIERPVFDDAEPLRFPKRSEAFVPQAFRVLRATGRERLEDENTWQNLEKRHDLGAFILSHLSSPYSFRYPLLILGDPGSGKSLLTHMLAARLICPQFTPIRVELRALESDEVAQQIEEQVTKDTNGQKVSWPEVNTQLRNAPALVLLDGYDELLQASGKVYAGYLQSVRQFQDTERTLGRPPVRAIVTSRITLIDKTRIPAGTTVIRLEPFDKTRRERWIEVWNRTNADYFKRSNPAVLPFEVSEDNKQVVELAEQPLLLLMLAIYDSYSNELRKKQGLDRTRLYEDLLRKFVDRELSKDPVFLHMGEADQDRLINIELERLGVIAMSMFNRRSLLIRFDELDVDLRFFECDRSREVPDGRVLRQSEMLLGSFFFVHESRSASKGRSAGEAEVESAFQFLHNTFGEFLAARFLVEGVIGQANKVHHLRQSPVLSAELDRKLVDPAGLDKGWIASLIYTPLFSRPVVLEMVREWLPHRLKDTLDVDSFRSALDTIVSAEFRRILERGQLPALISNAGQASFRALPVLGHLAIYTNNLIVLRTVIPDGRFVFREADYSTHEDGTRPWDRVTHMWRGWFALDSLRGLTAILTAERDEETVHLNVCERFTTPSPRDRLEAVRDVGRTLGDGALAGLAALEAWEPMSTDSRELERINQELKRERIDLRVEVMSRRLRSRLVVPRDAQEIDKLLKECMYLVERVGRERPFKTIEMVRLFVEKARLGGGYSAIRLILEVMARSAMGGPEEAAVFDFLLSTGNVELLHPRLLDELLRFRRPRDREHALVHLRAAVRVGDLRLARHLMEDVLSAEPREARRPRKIYLELEEPTFFELGPEESLALLKVAVANAVSDSWLSKKLKELWLNSLRPEVVIGLPPPMVIEAIRLLPLALDGNTAGEWLEEFFNHYFRPERSGSPALMFIVADVAAKLGSPVAKRLANDLVRSHPSGLLMSWQDGEMWHVKPGRSGQRDLFRVDLVLVLRVVRLAGDGEQARRWLQDLISEVMVPSVGELEYLPTEVLIELGRSIEQLGLNPEITGMVTHVLRRKLQGPFELLTRLEKGEDITRPKRKKERPTAETRREGGKAVTN